MSAGARRRTIMMPMPPPLPAGQQTVGPHFVGDRDVEALIFDFDGTLVDSMPLFYPAWPVACRAHGLPEMTEDEFYGFAGVPMPTIVEQIYAGHHGAGARPGGAFVEAFLKTQLAAADEVEARLGHPARIECVIALAEAAIARGLPVAVATSGLKDVVLGHLRHAGLDGMFSDAKGNLVVAADVSRGKPAPDIYLEAALRLGADPARCRAYEDGESGLMAAHAAGMHVVDVTGMGGYPAPGGLKRAKAAQVAARTWLAATPAAPGAGSKL
eukprot:SAG22_NODE_1215_length_5146_cov_1.556965_3_plen_270_part_00